MIKTTYNIYEAQLVTHGGSFHADEVMATVILGKIFGDVTVCRTSKVPDNLNPDVIVYDIGCGKFDHHQNGGAGTRTNGVPYAAAGLIWAAYGPELVKDTAAPKDVWFYIERKLIRGIDAIDNGTMPFVDYPANSMSFSKIISGFNPSWDSAEEPDKAFLKAVSFAEVVFDNLFERAVSKVRAREYVERAINQTDGDVMVLDEFLPWTDHLLHSRNCKAEGIKFVVYPSNRDKGFFNWHTIPMGGDRYSRQIQRAYVPEEWKGLVDKELQKVTGIPTAMFCHPSGVTGGAKKLEDAIAMAKAAIKHDVRKMKR